MSYLSKVLGETDQRSEETFWRVEPSQFSCASYNTNKFRYSQLLKIKRRFHGSSSADPFNDIATSEDGFGDPKLE